MFGNTLEDGTFNNRSLPADVRRVQLNNPVQFNLTRPALAVPGTGSDVQVIRIRPAGVVPVTGSEHKTQQVGPFPTDEQDRAVLSLGRVILVGNPGPNYFAGIRIAVGLWCVDRRNRPPVITCVFTAPG